MNVMTEYSKGDISRKDINPIKVNYTKKDEFDIPDYISTEINMQKPTSKLKIKTLKGKERSERSATPKSQKKREKSIDITSQNKNVINKGKYFDYYFKLDDEVSSFKGPIDLSNMFFKPVNVINDLLIKAFNKHKIIIFPLKVNKD